MLKALLRKNRIQKRAARGRKRAQWAGKRTGRSRTEQPSQRGKKNGNPIISAAKALGSKKLSGDIQVKIDNYTVPLTNLDKIYWPDEGYTKGDLIKYYFDIAKYILPYLKDRPLILKRYPNGIKGKFFFQHEVAGAPDFVRSVPIEAEDGRVINYAVCDNSATLLYLVNMGTIAQHPWNSRVNSLDHPDWLVFDLDPEQAEFSRVCEAALATKDILNRLGLDAYAKTSGSRGIHVYVDHQQNARGKSVVAPYSVRERVGATVAAPLDWPEVNSKLSLQDFTIETMPQRLIKKGDLFQPVLNKKQRLEQAIAKLEQSFDIPRARRAKA